MFVPQSKPSNTNTVSPNNFNKAVEQDFQVAIMNMFKDLKADVNKFLLQDFFFNFY